MESAAKAASGPPAGANNSIGRPASASAKAMVEKTSVVGVLYSPCGASGSGGAAADARLTAVSRASRQEGAALLSGEERY